MIFPDAYLYFLRRDFFAYYKKEDIACSFFETQLQYPLFLFF